MSCFGGLFHITKTSMSWWLYPQWLGDVQLGHLPTINPNINPSIIPYIIPSGWWYTYPSEKMSSSVGIMTFPTEWKFIKIMFQTTNQDTYV